MKQVLLCLCLFFVIKSVAQNNPISSITISLPPNPDASIANWKGGTSILTISAMARAVNGRPDVRVEDSKILVIIKKAGGKVCGSFTNSSAPAANFTTLNKVWSGNNAVSLLGQECTLPPGEYEISVQLFANGPRGLEPISEEKTRAFSIRGTEQQTYQPPQPMLPANGTIFKEDEIIKPVTFRWTPVVPRPQDPVTYRLRVWRMAEGQNSIPATIIQQPILSNDVGNITQSTIVQLRQSPPDRNLPETYVWNVQALNRDGKPIGSNNGTSEAFIITVQPVNDAPAVIKLVTPANKSTFSANDKIRFNWSINNSSSSITHYKLRIAEILLNQSPYDALRTNKPHFEKDSLIERAFITAPVFVSGKKYAWAVEGKGERGVKITESEINEFIISTNNTSTARLSLAYPANGETVRVQNPTFSWDSYLTPPDYDGDGYYKIKIVEIKGDESPDNAFRTNKPFFEKDSIARFKGNKPFFERDSLIRLDIQYPSSALQLEPGKRYAWNVQALNRDGRPVGTNNGTSETFMFTVPPAAANGERLSLVSPANGETLSSLNPTFDWTGGPFDVNGDGYYKIKIVEIKGDQSPEQAMRGNKPFFEKDSLHYFKGNKPHFEKDSLKPLSFQYPSSAPKLEVGKHYAWNIQVFDRNGKPAGPNNGTSDPFRFSIKDCNISFRLELISITCLPGGDPNNNRYRVCVASKYASSLFDLSFSNVGSRLTVSSSPGSGSYSLSGLTPGLQAQKKGAATTVNYCFEVNIPKDQTAIEVRLKGDDKGNAVVTCKAGAETKIKLPGCSTVCECGTWGSLSVQNAAGSLTYDCGKEIRWNCNKEFIFSTAFHCRSKNDTCKAKTSWIITKDGERYAFGNEKRGSFMPLTGGSYILRLNAGCDEKNCDTCVYSIVVDDCKTCKCGGWVRNGILIEGNKGFTQRANCGERLSLTKGAYGFDIPEYRCTDDTSCATSYSWMIEGTATAKGENQKPNFNFSEVGIYKLTVTPVCGREKCAPCNLTITVKESSSPGEEEEEDEKKILKNPPHYILLSSEYSSAVVTVKDTLFMQIENNYSSGSNQLNYTVRSLSKNKITRPDKIDIKNNHGIIRIALPLQNSIVAKGETGMITVWNSKKYYYLSFKRD